jgi:PAS domain S-box-containing protein
VRKLGATVDITRQKTTEAALRRSEEQFRLLADCIPQLAWVARPDGRVIWFNQRWYEYTGRLPEEMIGDGWQSVVDPVELQGMLPKYKAAMASGEPWEDTFPLRRHDGAMRWHLSRAVPLRDEQGRILHWFGTNTDITEQREVAAALREAKEAAEAASQAKDRFLAILSHELRTPLTPVMMAAGAMEKNQDLPESVRQDAAMIKDSVRLETKLIDDLLDLSRITSGKLLLQPESVDLNDAVLHVIGVCGASFNERCIRLHCSFDENVGTVFIDPARLQQVLWNVLRNAAKFTGEGGDVYVSTSVLPSGYYAVTVRDTGIGIAPEALSRIFDAFEQADNQITRTYGGLGLGLAISKAIIELQQGTIRAESEGLGKGTSFIVELEPERPGRLAPEAEPSGEAAQAGRRLRLLVVDDHDGTARMLERILQSLGHSVRSAGSIAETMSLLERETFDMLISDIGLPDGSGYELVQRVHERVRLPAIAVSGYGMVEDMERSKATGFDEHIVKPLDIGQLDKAIRRLSQREEGGSAS